MLPRFGANYACLRLPMRQNDSLTEGNIFRTLIQFALPVLLALFLQALYGGVDLLVVGQFAETADVSGVATGSMLMQTITGFITGLSMGVTILVGRRIGQQRPEDAGRAIGGGIFFFLLLAVLFTGGIVIGAEGLARFMNAPEEAFAQTVTYIRICGAGSLFILAYNLLGSIFRGLGDSTTPLITVAIACVLNIFGDLFFVAVLDMATAGAALATVLAQAVSVLASLLLIRRKTLPFTFTRHHIRFDREVIGTELRLGIPVGLQDLLVGISFLVIQMIINGIDVVSSAGVGVAEKICAFVMLVPSAYMQSMAAFTAQNRGAQKPERARKALGYGIATSIAVGLVIAYVSFFHGDLLSRLFSKDPAVIAASHNYLRAYSIDCLLTPFLFCFIGYFNGCGKTLFVMLQGILGAFGVRVPVVYFVSLIPGVSLFQIGLGTPASTTVQITLCLIMFFHMNRKERAQLRPDL